VGQAVIPASILEKEKIMTKILNWGLLSTARINRALITPLRASKRNHLLAVASRSQESADAYAREKKIPRAHKVGIVVGLAPLPTIREGNQR
jgi:hypothetical protein